MQSQPHKNAAQPGNPALCGSVDRSSLKLTVISAAGSTEGLRGFKVAKDFPLDELAELEVCHNVAH